MSYSTAPVHVLFLCMGNICRSPMAEGLFTHLVQTAGLAKRFVIDSAGMGPWHVGEPPDPRTRAVAERYGFPLPTKCRQMRPKDVRNFHYILGMDRVNVAHAMEMQQAYGGSAQIELVRAYDPEAPEAIDLPDPYQGTPEDFEAVYRVLARTLPHFLAKALADPQP